MFMFTVSSLWRLTMHGMFLIGQQLWQGPEGVFFVHEHEEQGGDLTHPLAVAHLLQATDRQKNKGRFHFASFLQICHIMYTDDIKHCLLCQP